MHELLPVDDRAGAVRGLVRLSRLLERNTGELSLAHYRVLNAVADGDERASRLAIRLALGKPAVSAAVESLVHRGLLARSEVDGDQRATSLRLTAEGEAVLIKVNSALTSVLDDVASRTTNPDAVLARLAELDAALDEIANERFASRAGNRP